MRAVLALLLAAVPGVAAPPMQPLDRRARAEPEIVPETGGRAGPCDVVQFTPAGDALLAAGDDKVVRAWPYTVASGLTTDGAKTLRWPAWREQRGGIKAFALTKDAGRVVVGGFGMRHGVVGVIDRASGELKHLTWPVPPANDPSENYFSVTAVAFSPDDTRVAFGTADGSLWVWTPGEAVDPKAPVAPGAFASTGKPPVRVGKHEPGRVQPDRLNLPMLVLFDGARIVSVAETGEVRESDPAGRAPSKPVFNVNDGRRGRYDVFRAVRAGDAIAVACRGPRVLVRPLNGAPGTTIDLPHDSFPRSLAFQPSTGRLAVGVGAARRAAPTAPDAPRFYHEDADRVRIYSDALAAPKLAREWRHRGPAEALAFHPAADRLAIAGGDADEVTVMDPALPAKPGSVARGAGRRVWGVGISENGQILSVRPGHAAALDGADQPGGEPWCAALGAPAAAAGDRRGPNHRGAGAWCGFDLSRLNPVKNVAPPPPPVETADGWSIVPSTESRFVWHARHAPADGPALTADLPLDPRRDQAPTCYAFLPAKAGKPTRLLVGHYYGASLFELRVENGRAVAARTRVYIGHAGEVLCLSASPDQKWFVTGGADHTLAAYTLADWDHHPNLGAAFAPAAKNNLTVTGVAVGSPAWEAGLERGAIVHSVTVGGGAAAPNPAAALGQINEAVPSREILFEYRANDKAEPTGNITTVRQRPLWKMLPTFAADESRFGDWVVWSWRGGFYHTTAAHGDKLAGWHVNHPDIDGTPSFHKLADFEAVFHRRAIVATLIQTLSVAEALKVAKEDSRADARTLTPHPFSRYEPAPVRLARKESVVGKNGANLTVTVKPRGNNPDRLPDRVELWVNDHRIEDWRPNGAEVNRNIIVPRAAFRAGTNRVTVQVTTRDGVRSAVTESLENPVPAASGRLLALTVGINDYAGHRLALNGRAGFDDLSSARNDAEKLASKLTGHGGVSVVKIDKGATRPELVKAIRTVAGTATPNDTLVVFFAGHGDLLGPAPAAGAGPGARGDTPAGPGVFVLCGPDYAKDKADTTGITTAGLFDELARVNCRKVVLLDACHSGRAAAETATIRGLLPAGEGPVVITACDQSELSYEHKKYNHGLFTFAVLEALGDKFPVADLARDGTLSPDDLFRYVSARVPQLMRDIGRANDTQTPVCFPRTPPRFAVVGGGR